jgi:hypothetical protein
MNIDYQAWAPVAVRYVEHASHFLVPFDDDKEEWRVKAALGYLAMALQYLEPLHPYDPVDAVRPYAFWLGAEG